jgi:hypothetical protein
MTSPVAIGHQTDARATLRVAAAGDAAFPAGSCLTGIGRHDRANRSANTENCNRGFSDAAQQIPPRPRPATRRVKSSKRRSSKNIIRSKTRISFCLRSNDISRR